MKWIADYKSHASRLDAWCPAGHAALPLEVRELALLFVRKSRLMSQSVSMRHSEQGTGMANLSIDHKRSIQTFIALVHKDDFPPLFVLRAVRPYH